MPYLETLTAKFGAEAFTTSSFRDNQRLQIAPELLIPVLTCLKDECGFLMLAELTCVDYLNYPDARDRYGVIYGLTNIDTGERVFVKVFVNDPDPKLPSVFPLWKGSNWMEREVFDMYGIVFEGHPDLRRILLPEEFASFPLRKDYPLRGRGERHNFPVLTRAES